MAKRQRPTIKAKKDVDASSQQEEVMQQLKKEKEVVEKKTTSKGEKKTKRFTMDLPKELHQQITEKVNYTGQTMKGYFLSLARKDLES